MYVFLCECMCVNERTCIMGVDTSVAHHIPYNDYNLNPGAAFVEMVNKETMFKCLCSLYGVYDP